MRDLTERLEFMTAAPVALSVTVTRSGATATADAATAHGFTDGDFVEMAGANQSEYNGEFAVDVTDADSFTYTVTGAPVTPATGTITALFKSDAQGGQGEGWRSHVTVWGAMRPLSASELLQAEAIRSNLTYEAEIQYREDIVPTMRIRWTPYRHTTAKTLEVHGVLPHPLFPRERLTINCGEVA